MSFRKKAKAKLQRRIISLTRSGDGPPVNAEDISIDPWTDRVNRVTCPQVQVKGNFDSTTFEARPVKQELSGNAVIHLIF